MNVKVYIFSEYITSVLFIVMQCIYYFYIFQKKKVSFIFKLFITYVCLHDNKKIENHEEIHLDNPSEKQF